MKKRGFPPIMWFMTLLLAVAIYTALTADHGLGWNIFILVFFSGIWVAAYFGSTKQIQRKSDAGSKEV